MKFAHRDGVEAPSAVPDRCADVLAGMRYCPRMGDHTPTSDSSSGSPADATTSGQAAQASDFDRELGVVEAITVVTRSCPSGVVVAAAERALDAIKEGGPDVIKQQAYFVLTALQGWRGDRARQVHRSLTAFLEENSSP